MSDCDVSQMEERMCQPYTEEVDQYNNTPDSFKYCSFPDCGCDGARLCMAPNGPSEAALLLNHEKRVR